MKNLTLNERVYRNLKAKIINSEFEPGKPIILKNLIKIFKTSRTPIKEAINRLEKEGLVKNFNYRGAFINILTIKEIKEIYQIRSALEPLAVRLAINQIKEDDLNKFEQSFMELEKQHDGKKLIELIMKFHRFIQKFTQNDLLYSLMDNLYNQIEATKNFISKSPIKTEEGKSEIISAHLKIIYCLKRKNVEEAEKYMGDHINKALEKMLSIL